ncbi:very long chain fatty acid elongase AAEL008004 [Anabrus simplex]|uniref:very long chain fatty acid elongase AAEL008004 n=1 Tax=Anabrus simplex TaxID=316456 RepID=UPI0035A3CD98
MAALLGKMYHTYNYLFYDLADPRTNNLFLIPSPFPGLALVASYVYITKFLGPRLMMDRKPFELKKIIQLYNVVQIIANVYIFAQCLRLGWAGTYSWTCEPVDYSNTPTALEVAHGVYHFFLIKVLDLLDTIFFVLRKKSSQISFLHVYHHAGMVMLTWGAAKYLPGGHGTFLGFINSFVHIIMYSYYLLASLSSDSRKYLWWKKHLTQLQMVQFFFITIHSLQLLFVENCGYPVWTTAVVVPQNAFMSALFYDFYRKAYRPSKKTV